MNLRQLFAGVILLFAGKIKRKKCNLKCGRLRSAVKVLDYKIQSAELLCPEGQIQCSTNHSGLFLHFKNFFNKRHLVVEHDCLMGISR